MPELRPRHLAASKLHAGAHTRAHAGAHARANASANARAHGAQVGGRARAHAGTHTRAHACGGPGGGAHTGAFSEGAFKGGTHSHAARPDVLAARRRQQHFVQGPAAAKHLHVDDAALSVAVAAPSAWAAQAAPRAAARLALAVKAFAVAALKEQI